MVPEYYDIANNDRSEDELGALRQVSVDVPRTAPGVAFFHEAPVQKCLERILYIWGIRYVALQIVPTSVCPMLKSCVDCDWTACNICFAHGARTEQQGCSIGRMLVSRHSSRLLLGRSASNAQTLAWT